MRLSDADHKLLVMDAAIGQQASEQARVFHDAINITGVIITKLDGTAKGGGALSAVAETKTSVAFIGVGETPADLEKFEADRFISRLLGMGDIKTLIERAQEIQTDEAVDMEALMKGRFTLKDMYQQMEAMNKLGPLKQIMQMLPLGGLGVELSDSDYQMTKDRLDKFRVIMDSMTQDELNDPKMITASRVKRISLGSGTSPENVKELLKAHQAMQKAIKGMRGGMGKMNMKRLMKKFGPGMKM